MDRQEQELRVRSIRVLEKALARLNPYEAPPFYQNYDAAELLGTYSNLLEYYTDWTDDENIVPQEVMLAMQTIAQCDDVQYALDDTLPYEDKDDQEREVWDAVVKERRPMLLWANVPSEHASLFSFIPVWRILQSPEENAQGQWVVQAGCPDDDVLPLVDSDDYSQVEGLPYEIFCAPTLPEAFIQVYRWFSEARKADNTLAKDFFTRLLPIQGVDVPLDRYQEGEQGEMICKLPHGKVSLHGAKCLLSVEGPYPHKVLVEFEGLERHVSGYLAFAYLAGYLNHLGLLPPEQGWLRPAQASDEPYNLDYINHLFHRRFPQGCPPDQALHPYEMPAGAALLCAWARHPRLDMALSVAHTLPYLSMPLRDELLLYLAARRERALQLALAWALACGGEEKGLETLEVAASDGVYYQGAQHYLKLLGRDPKQYPITPAMQAVQQMASWLAQPSRRETLPSRAEVYYQMVVDLKDLGGCTQAFVIEFEYPDGSLDYGVVGIGEPFWARRAYPKGSDPLPILEEALEVRRKERASQWEGEWFWEEGDGM